MATKRIETQLTIKAVDQYSGMLRNMRTVTGRFADGVRSDMKRLQGLRGSLKLIEDFRTTQAEADKSREAFERQKLEVRRLREEMRKSERPTQAMARDLDQARRNSESLRRAHVRHSDKLREMGRGLQQAGINTADLGGEQRRLSTALDASSGAFGRQMERMRRLETMQTRIADARERMDRGLASAANLSFVGAASVQSGRRILTAMTNPVQKAIEFESAMADVRKVVDFDTPDGFARMSDDILELSTRIPMAAEGLAQIVAAGGQSGVEREDLTRFAEMAAKIGVAFDISAEHAGSSMAGIKTAMGLTLDQTGSLFDAMNHLSNNSAARADQTLDFLNRAGASGATFGFSNTETLAFGAAMIAAGSGADTAATSFRNMGRALTRGDSATKRQSDAMKKLGLDAAQVAKDMQRDAVGTTADVLQRLRQLPDHLRASVMTDLFGDEARELTKLINNAELLPQLLGLVADERQYLGSAEKEYAARAETTANNLQLMRNQMTRLGVTVGEVVLPPLNDLLEKGQEIVEWAVDWAKEHPKLTKLLVVGGVALGAMAVAGGALLTVGAGLIGTMAVMRFGLAGLGARAAFAAADLLGVGGSFRKLTGLPRFALSKLLKPVHWGAGLIGRIPWVRLAGRLALSSLILPLRWTSALLPGFGPALARFTGFRRDASAEITGLSTHVQRQSATMRRSLSRIRWGAFSAGVASYFALRSAPDDPKELGAFQEANARAMDRTFRSLPGVSHLMSGYERVFEWAHGKPPPVDPALLPRSGGVRAAADTVYGFAGQETLPTPERIARLREEVGLYRADVEAAQAAVRAAPESESGLTNPLRVQAQAELAAAEADLQRAQEQLESSEAASVKLTEALQVLNGTETAPEISTASIDHALEKVRKLSAGIRALSAPGRAEAAAPIPAGARARGGPVQMGLPYLVNENTPRSEWFVPSRSGGILNVSQAQTVFRQHLAGIAARRGAGSSALKRLQRGAFGLRAASAAVLAGSVIAAPAAAQHEGPGPGGGSVTVQIDNFTVQVPSGVSDPDAIAEVVADRLGQRVAATMSASFSD
jgi:TP901 family phage tail tape measure protein